ncbi:hypothetical protein NDU88_002297 [Pleurodeles waltl]|uniref:Uncharacterized protein n=1 Tax=Pleurodeles waltl TaxID=8319 RepID=A0AAV7KV95_PLEWA|nr:hypothetical protein NDU88_002297 [Pleurodeles waltl]
MNRQRLASRQFVQGLFLSTDQPRTAAISSPEASSGKDGDDLCDSTPITTYYLCDCLCALESEERVLQKRSRTDSEIMGGKFSCPTGSLEWHICERSPRVGSRSETAV